MNRKNRPRFDPTPVGMMNRTVATTIPSGAIHRAGAWLVATGLSSARTAPMPMTRYQRKLVTG